MASDSLQKHLCINLHRMLMRSLQDVLYVGKLTLDETRHHFQVFRMKLNFILPYAFNTVSGSWNQRANMSTGSCASHYTGRPHKV